MISFLLDELITCGAVLSTFELTEALRQIGAEAEIVSPHRNPDLEAYFGVIPMREVHGTTVAVSPRCKGEWAYVRTRDDRWRTHPGKKIAVSRAIADWLGTDLVLGNGTHGRFRDFGIDRDIAVLVVGNDEPNKNMLATLKAAKRLTRGKIVWVGRQTRPVEGVESVSDVSVGEMPYFYNRAQTFLTLSRNEGWGRPVAEARACGVPAIINHNGGNTDVEVVPWESIAKQFISIVCA